MQEVNTILIYFTLLSSLQSHQKCFYHQSPPPSSHTHTHTLSLLGVGVMDQQVSYQKIIIHNV